MWVDVLMSDYQDIEDEIKTQIELDVQQAKEDPVPTVADLTTDVYVDNDKRKRGMGMLMI